MKWPAPETVERVPHKGERITVLICSVHDGDTMTAIVPFGKAFLKLDIRVEGIDAPEVQVRGETKGTALGDLEERAGAAVRNHVAALCNGKEMQVCLHKNDKFGGRLLGTVYLSESETLTQHLLARHYCKAYGGQKKSAWTEQELKRILDGAESTAATL